MTFLVRPRRAAQLARDRLVVISPHGDLRLAVATATRETVRPEYDLAILSCKTFDLTDAIETLRPAVGANTLVLPLLNGVGHYEALDAAFGRERVPCGTCHVAATLTEAGEVRQLSQLHRIAFGTRPGNVASARARLAELQREFAKTPIPAVLSDDMATEMWEKYVLLTTLAGMTCLMRSSVGDIMLAERGRELMLACLESCRKVAEAAGQRLRDEFLADTIKLLTEPGSTFTASMLRDIEGGRRTECEHIVGHMARRAAAAGIDAPLLAAAHCHLQAYEARRTRSLAQK
jgi:2-dehydropantoate 2-reductase